MSWVCKNPRCFFLGITQLISKASPASRNSSITWEDATANAQMWRATLPKKGHSLVKYGYGAMVKTLVSGEQNRWQMDVHPKIWYNRVWPMAISEFLCFFPHLLAHSQCWHWHLLWGLRARLHWRSGAWSCFSVEAGCWRFFYRTISWHSKIVTPCNLQHMYSTVHQNTSTTFKIDV